MRGSRILYSLILYLFLINAIPVYSQEIQDTLKAALVSDNKAAAKGRERMGLVRLDENELNYGFAFLSSPDIIKSIQMLPGVAYGTELMSGLYVHGGDGSENMFLLDGAPLFQVSHLAGLFSSFNTDIVESIDFYKSGFPSNYGGKLSSVVDISTKSGDFDLYKGSFTIGLLDGRFHLRGPIVKNKLSFSIAARRNWLDLIARPVIALYNKGEKDKTEGAYSFYDINAKLSYRLLPKSRLDFSFYAGKDNFEYSKSNQEKIYGKKIFFAASGNDINMKWGNIAASLNWSHIFNDSFKCGSRFFYSTGFSSIENNFLGYDLKDEVVKKKSEKNELGGSAGTLGVASDFEFIIPYNRLSFGFLYKHYIYFPESGKVVVKEDKVLSHSSIRYKYNPNEFEVYAEDKVLLGPLSISAGLRLSYFINRKKSYLSPQPRFAANYRFTDNLFLKASYSLMSQPQHLLSSLYLDLPTNIWLPSTDKIKPAKSEQFAMSLYSRFSSSWYWEIGGYYKATKDCLMYSGKTSLFPKIEKWEENFFSGQALSYGIELEGGYDSRRIKARVYYTLSWSKKYFRDLCPEWFLDRFDNRHKITLFASFKINSRWDVNASWNYHSGNRVTLPEQIANNGGRNAMIFFPRPYNAKMPAYHRLDLGLNYRKVIKRGRESIWNISVYNLYSRMNPFSMGFISTEDGSLVAKVNAIVPIIPSFSYTFKF